MNKNTKRRTALIRKDVKADGGEFTATRNKLLASNSSRVEDSRSGRGRSTSYRYCNV